MGAGRRVRSSGKALKAKKTVQPVSKHIVNEKSPRAYAKEEKISPNSRLYNAINTDKK
jgi:hypothetical protein